MKKLLQLILLAAFAASFPIFAHSSFAADRDFESTSEKSKIDLDNVDDDTKAKTWNRTDNTDAFRKSVESSSDFGFWNPIAYFETTDTGAKWAKNLMMRIARDLKNAIMLIAIAYLILSVFRILVSGGSEEDIKKWKTSIIWTTLGIVVMQSSYSVVKLLFDKNVNANTALDFSKDVLMPFVHLLQVLASFAFLAMAFFAFYKIVTAWGDEEKAKWGKKTIIFAVLGFFLIKLPETLIGVLYGKANCDTVSLFGATCQLKDPKISESITLFTSVINYVNGFLTLVIVMLIIYAGFLVLTSGGDDEKMKKAKGIVKYIVIGVLLLVTSYILFRFFVDAGGTP